MKNSPNLKLSGCISFISAVFQPLYLTDSLLFCSFGHPGYKRAQVAELDISKLLWHPAQHPDSAAMGYLACHCHYLLENQIQSSLVLKLSRVSYVSWSWQCEEDWLFLQFQLIWAKI